MKQISCRKCLGKGIIHNYKHVEGGICFTCNGSGVETVSNDTTDTVKLIREERKQSKALEMQFDSLYNESKLYMSREWNNYIMGITGIENKFHRLQSYIAYKIEKKKRAVELNINDPDFDEKYISLIDELDTKYMIEEEN